MAPRPTRSIVAAIALAAALIAWSTPALAAPAAALYPFTSVVVTWRRWVEAWKREQAGAKHLARFDGKADIVDRRKGSTPAREFNPQIFDAQQILCHFNATSD